MAKGNNKEKLSPRVIVKLVLLIVIVAAIILVPIIYSGTTYIKAWNTNKKTPFAPTVTESTDESSSTTTTETPRISGLILDDVQRIDNKDFNLFDITFQATSYNDREADKVQQVSFSIVIKKNDNTPTNMVETSNSSNCLVSTGLVLCANWISLESYQSSLSNFSESYLTNGTSRNVTLACTTQFPAKADTWPVKVTVDSPDCYMYLYFRTQENGKYKNNSYILKYTYDEYMTESTQGGIEK